MRLNKYQTVNVCVYTNKKNNDNNSNIKTSLSPLANIYTHRIVKELLSSSSKHTVYSLGPIGLGHHNQIYVDYSFFIRDNRNRRRIRSSKKNKNKLVLCELAAYTIHI